MSDEQRALDALQAFVDEAGGQIYAAPKLGYTPQYIGQILNGQKNMPEKLLKKFGFKRAIVVAK